MSGPGVPVFGPGGGFPTGQQQPQIHPTVPYGQQGAPQAIVVQPNQMMPQPGQVPQQGYPQQGQPQYAAQQQQPPSQQGQPQPVPAQGWVSQQQGTFAPGNQPPWMNRQPQPQAQPQPQQIPDNFVMDGPNVPAELRGRTWAQIRGTYTTLAQEFASQPGRIPAPRPNNLAPTPAPAVQGNGGNGAPNTGQANPQQPTRSFWEDPEGAISRVVDQRLAPITQRSLEEGIRSAHQQAAQSIQDFAILEPELMNVMARAPEAAMLADPEFWRSTARLVRGKLMEEGRYATPGTMQPVAGMGQPQFNQPNPQQQYPQPGVPLAPPAGRGPGVFQPAGAFFTEAPTAPQPGYNNVGGNGVLQYELTPQQKDIAAKMNMSEQEYRDWGVGIQQAPQTRRW